MNTALPSLVSRPAFTLRLPRADTRRRWRRRLARRALLRHIALVPAGVALALIGIGVLLLNTLPGNFEGIGQFIVGIAAGWLGVVGLVGYPIALAVQRLARRDTSWRRGVGEAVAATVVGAVVLGGGLLAVLMAG